MDPHVGINDEDIEPTYVIFDIGEEPFTWKKFKRNGRFKKSEFKNLDIIKRKFKKYIIDKYGKFDDDKMIIKMKSKEYHSYNEGYSVRVYRFIPGIHKKYTPVVELSYIDEKWPRHDWVLIKMGSSISFYVI